MEQESRAVNNKFRSHKNLSQSHNNSSLSNYQKKKFNIKSTLI